MPQAASEPLAEELDALASAVPADEVHAAIRELQRLAELTESKLAAACLQRALGRLRIELEADAADLRRLASQTTNAEVRSHLQEQAAALLPAGAAAAPAEEEAASPHADDGNSADVEDGDEGRDEAPKKAAKANGVGVKGGAKAAWPEAPADAAPSAAASEASLDPRSWPVVDSASSLPTELPAGVRWYQPPRLPLRQIPRCAADSELAKQLLLDRKPVVLTQGKLVSSAQGKWTLDYLEANLRGLPCNVFRSASRDFTYWDETKNAAGYPMSGAHFTEKLTMPISDFAARLRRGGSGAGGDGGGDGGDDGGGDGGGAEAAATGAEAAVARGGDAERQAWHYMYLQTTLVDGVGAAMLDDFKAFDWAWLTGWQKKMGWSELTSNLLFIGQRGAATPAHYDEQQNLFAQLSGRKRCVLFAPGDVRGLYPYPLHHPKDRQTQLDMYAPDLARFPRFGDVLGLEAVLAPGDLLYIPQYWWHHIENLDERCVSLNFWFRDQATASQPTLPLSDGQQLAMRRNIEKLVGQQVGPKAAQRWLPKLATDAADLPAEVASLRATVRKLLGHVMPEPEIDPWLRELVESRFDLGPLEDGAVV